MVGELVKLPVRVGTRVTRLWFRAIEETVSLGVGATGRVVELLASRSSNGAGVEAPPREPRRPAQPPPPAEPAAREAPAPSRPARTTPAQSLPKPAAPTPPPVASTPAAAEPVHVSEEPVLIDEFAEPGAEQGAGAEVHVDPPWDGYERMTAKQVITRLGTADSAELAAVQLHEGTNRRRQTIMNAVERALRDGQR